MDPMGQYMESCSRAQMLHLIRTMRNFLYIFSIGACKQCDRVQQQELPVVSFAHGAKMFNSCPKALAKNVSQQE